MNQSAHMIVAVIEQTSTGYSAYVPEFPGCIATGRSEEQVKRRMLEALSVHLEVLAEYEIGVPSSSDIGVAFTRS